MSQVNKWTQNGKGLLELESSLHYQKQLKARGMAQVAEHLPSKRRP
jgi:hypothetical protein